MKKVLLLAALLGVLVALTIGLVAWYEYDHGEANAPVSNVVRMTINWVFPASVIMHGDAEDVTTVLILFGIAVLANGLIYSFVAFLIAWLWEEISTPHAVREAIKTGRWPTKPSNR